MGGKKSHHGKKKSHHGETKPWGCKERSTRLRPSKTKYEPRLNPGSNTKQKAVKGHFFETIGNM